MSAKLNASVRPPSRRFVHRGAGRDVLLAVFEGEDVAAGVRRASSLARTLDATLHVVQVVAGPWPMASISSESNLVELTRFAELAIQMQRAVRAQLIRACPDDLPPHRLCIRGGDFVAQVAARALEVGAGLIVMSEARGRTGRVVTRLACVTRLPVLVARDGSCTDTIVAATDLEDPSYPVLRTATNLGRRLDKAVLALHNVSPVSFLSAGTVALPAMLSASREVVLARRERLELAVRRACSRATPIVADHVDPAEAIVKVARDRDVDLIVVGIRPRSWFERLLVGSVAARVVNRAGRSVLVVPVDAGGATGEASLAWGTPSP